MILHVLGRIFARTFGTRANLPKLLLVLVIIVALPALAYSRGFGNQPAELSASAREMLVERFDPSQQNNMLLFNLVLKEKDGPRRLVLSIGGPEAASIVQDIKDPRFGAIARPATAYQLTGAVAESLGGKVNHVVVNNVNNDTFFAKVVMTTESRQVEVDAAPSDAIALALRAKVPIYVEGAVLEKAGILSPR